MPSRHLFQTSHLKTKRRRAKPFSCRLAIDEENHSETICAFHRNKHKVLQNLFGSLNISSFDGRHSSHTTVLRLYVKFSLRLSFEQLAAIEFWWMGLTPMCTTTSSWTGCYFFNNFLHCSLLSLKLVQFHTTQFILHFCNASFVNNLNLWRRYNLGWCDLLDGAWLYRLMVHFF